MKTVCNQEDVKTTCMKDIVNVIVDEKIMTTPTSIAQIYCIIFHRLAQHMEICLTSTNCYTQYCIQCQMVPYGNVTTFLV